MIKLVYIKLSVKFTLILIIITGFLFTLGNILWPVLKDQKYFYVPLALFISFLLYYVNITLVNVGVITKYIMRYFLLLSFGNIVKQLLYTPTLKQINDYIWGGLCTLGLITLILWEIHKHGGNNPSKR